MDLMTLGPTIVRGNEDQSRAQGLRSVARKSALLNVVIVLTAFPVLVAAGGPLAVYPALAIMAGISLLIWTATYTLYFCVALLRLCWTPASSGKRRDRQRPAEQAGVGDRWLDGPG
jgi:hypothetical protein